MGYIFYIMFVLIKDNPSQATMTNAEIVRFTDERRRKLMTRLETEANELRDANESISKLDRDYERLREIMTEKEIELNMLKINERNIKFTRKEFCSKRAMLMNNCLNTDNQIKQFDLLQARSLSNNMLNKDGRSEI